MKIYPLLFLLLLLGCQAGPQPPEHHHDESHEGLTLTLEQMKQAGIEVAPVAYRDLEGGFETTAVIEADPDRQVVLSSRVPGVVSRLLVSLGESVAAGHAVAVVESPDLARAKADYHHARVESELATHNLSTRERLAKLGDETQRQLESARNELAAAAAEVKIREARELTARQRLRRIEALLKDGIASRQQLEQAVESHHEASAELEKAGTALKIARSHLERESAIYSQGLRVSKEVWEARSKAARSSEELRHNRELLELLGARPETHEATLTVITPLAGTVTERSARQGQRVEAGEPLATVTDLSQLWIWLDLYDRDLSRTRVGMRTEVEVSAYPGRTFNGSLDYIDATMNPETRTVRGRVVLKNAEHLLKPGMFAQVRLDEMDGRSRLVVPRTALVTIDGEDAVYVDLGQGSFERRTVQTGLQRKDEVEVVKGLKAGEKIAVKGTFALKSLDEKEKMGGHSH